MSKIDISKIKKQQSGQSGSGRFRGGKETSEFSEKILGISRVSRTVKGGRRIRFRVLVAIGNMKGRVGIGIAKAADIPTTVSKAAKIAKKGLITVPIINGTIPHRVQAAYGGASVLLKPAREGSSVVAGGTVRAIIDLVGIKNISSKVLGSSNKLNNAKAIIIALENLKAREAKKIIKEKDETTSVKKSQSSPKEQKSRTGK